ncbi:MAG: M15 family metallopeptidase [Alphaproteobacteria bacterium]|nr:M15 family metallopeptidase [Alphaproteobacteria bacterium]
MSSFDQVVNGIHVYESEDPPALVDMKATGAFLFCQKYANDFRLRTEVCDRILRAQKKLPEGYRFLLYEAFRPRTRQIELWDNVLAQLRRTHPDWTDAQRVAEADAKFVANPYSFGSGHQAGAAVDITLCSDTGREFSMGTDVQEFGPRTVTDCADIGIEETRRRNILRSALESEGVINFPGEWWHFCYGDRLWAEITKRENAFFAPLD